MSYDFVFVYYPHYFCILYRITVCIICHVCMYIAPMFPYVNTFGLFFHSTVNQAIRVSGIKNPIDTCYIVVLRSSTMRNSRIQPS